MLRSGRSHKRIRKASPYILSKHKVILLLTAALWIGIIIAFVLYVWTDVYESDWIASICKDAASSSGMTMEYWSSYAYTWVILILILFLSGMCAFGCPLVLAVIWFCGFRIGLDQCCTYQWYGIGTAFIASALPALLYSVALVGLGAQEWRLSASVSEMLIGQWPAKRSLRLFRYCLLWVFIALFIVGVTALFQSGIGIVLGI